MPLLAVGCGLHIAIAEFAQNVCGLHDTKVATVARLPPPLPSPAAQSDGKARKPSKRDDLESGKPHNGESDDRDINQFFTKTLEKRDGAPRIVGARSSVFINRQSNIRRIYKRAFDDAQRSSEEEERHCAREKVSPDLVKRLVNRGFRIVAVGVDEEADEANATIMAAGRVTSPLEQLASLAENEDFSAATNVRFFVFLLCLCNSIFFFWQMDDAPLLEKLGNVYRRLVVVSAIRADIFELKGTRRPAFGGGARTNFAAAFLDHPFFVGTQFLPELTSRPFAAPKAPYLGLVLAAAGALPAYLSGEFDSKIDWNVRTLQRLDPLVR